MNRIDKYKKKLDSKIIGKKYDATKDLAVRQEKKYSMEAEELELKVKSIVSAEPTILHHFYIAFAEELVKKTTHAEREIIYNKWFARGLKHLKLRQIGNALFNLRLNTTFIGSKQDPVLYLAMSEGTGTKTKDNSGYGNNGIITGAAWTEGIIGKCLSFDGVSSDRVLCGNDASLNFGTEDFSIATWFKLVDVTGTDYIIEKYGDSGCDYNLVVTEIQLWFWFGDGINVVICRIPIADVDDGEWHHVVGVRTSALASVYLDGKLRDTEDASAVGAVTDNTGNLSVGDYEGGGYSFNGLIDEIRLFKRALTAEEIKNMYDSEKLC